MFLSGQDISGESPMRGTPLSPVLNNSNKKHPWNLSLTPKYRAEQFPNAFCQQIMST